MKILHINTHDKTGGAAIAAFRLHNAMLSAGMDSRYFVLDRTINDRIDIVTISTYLFYLKKIVNIILEKIITRKMRGIKGVFSSFRYGINISRENEVIQADIIYLHWINSFINYRGLKNILGTGKQVFWFMHDMFAITGGCHYSFDCMEYQAGCLRCSYRQGRNTFNLSKSQYKMKKKIYKQFDNLKFIAPSEWLYNCAKRSGLTRDKQIYHIPNVINKNIYRFLNVESARELYSLGYSTKIIGFGADSALTNPYKGWEYLKEALQFLSKDKTLQNMTIEILVFGSNYSKIIIENIPFHVHFVGRLQDEYSLAMLYNCMNVFVIPSLAENFPNTILESLNCNVPVVGFNIGGIPDLVNENTGYLAEYKNSKDLAKGISILLKKEINVYGANKSFTPEIILDKHLKMYMMNNLI